MSSNPTPNPQRDDSNRPKEATREASPRPAEPARRAPQTKEEDEVREAYGWGV
ncbi:MAG: hypothetical protein JNK60_13690 [Acidobacteria bacterium]|nr:hypothetical protein [Acidobacteriota bacterium]